MRISEGWRVRWSGVSPTMVVEGKSSVERGVWTTDFTAVTNAAEASHLPVVVFALLPDCPYCMQLHDEVQSEEVKAWQKKLGWYFVMGTSSEAPELHAFVKTSPVRIKKPPYVGVYWRRANGERVMRNFTARSGHMGVSAEPSLASEWMHAVEASVPGAPGTTYVKSQGLGVQVSVSVESEKFRLGSVKMSPQVEVIHSGQKVALTAKPRVGSEFVGWRYPDGRVVDEGPQLTLDDKCQAGEYKAIFRRRKRHGRGGALRTEGTEK